MDWDKITHWNPHKVCVVCGHSGNNLEIYEQTGTPHEVAAFEMMLRESKMLRMGTDCYAYALLAHGLIDVVMESCLKPYDIQALIPIVQGAGGVITDWQGGPADNSPQVLACGDAMLHADILERLSRLAR